MRFATLMPLLAASCMRLPHLDPVPRSPSDAARLLATVEANCSGSGDFSDFEGSTEIHGTGVVISERHVLTAAHVVACPGIPGVRITLADGRSFPAVVEKDDAMFGGGTDVARLEILSAETFGLGAIPPRLATGSPEDFGVWDEWCAITMHGPACGPVGTFDVGIATFRAATQAGDSGAPVQDSAGKLVGLTIEGSGKSTKIARPVAWWLEGT